MGGSQQRCDPPFEIYLNVTSAIPVAASLRHRFDTDVSSLYAQARHCLREVTWRSSFLSATRRSLISGMACSSATTVQARTNTRLGLNENTSATGQTSLTFFLSKRK